MKQVLIIGAGPAGITAGYELLKNRNSSLEEYDVTILEESSSIGGISRTINHNGNRMDIGGHRFFSKDESVTKWWDEIMPKQGAPAIDDKILKRDYECSKGGPDPEKTDRVMLNRKRISRIYYNKKFFDYPIKINFTTIKNMGLLVTLLAGLSYMKSSVNKKKEDSLENFYINRFGKKLYTMFFEGYTEKLWGIHPKNISADWGSQRVKGISISVIIKDILRKAFKPSDNRNVETSLIERFWYPKLGPGQLWEIAAQEFCNMGGKIRKNCKVIEVHTEGSNVKEVVCEENGQKKILTADIFISSMPVKDLVSCMNYVPKNVERIAKGLPYRDFVTVGLCVKKLNLKNKTKIPTIQNIVPDCWIYVQDTSVKLGRIQIFNNWSPYMVKDVNNTVWIGLEYFCSESDEYFNMDETSWVKFATQELIKMGILSSSDDIIDYHKECVKKAYPAYFGTYKEIDKVIEYLSSIENLYCVGRNGQHRYNNMDHSMLTSFEAVKNIREGIASKDNIFSVNTEESYHEQRA